MKRNGFAFVVTAIVVVLTTAAVAFVKLRPQPQYVCINNSRPFLPEQYEKWKKEEAEVGAVVTNGSTFSNIVSILGTNFTTLRMSDKFFYATFKCEIPGATNLHYVTFDVRSNIANWITTPPFHGYSAMPAP